ncbi:glycosyltransferase family 4 protein [Deinococcus sp. SM5_A1]|uniref:glycosyltransferase family 4 protein n=1 Tax=Deinococcus sp. SM5_A1 TaxID=3379094 RepID=UPI00385EBDF0
MTPAEPEKPAGGKAALRGAVRVVALIDPLWGGHHGGYAVTLAQGLTDQGIRVHIIGPAPFVEEVCRAVQQATGHVLPLFPGSGPDSGPAYYRLTRVARDRVNLRFLRAALRMAGGLGADTAHLLWLDSFLTPLVAVLVGRKNRAVAVRGTLHWAYFLREFEARRFSQPVHRALLRALGILGVRVITHSRMLNRRIQGGRLDMVPYPTPTSQTSVQERQAAGQAVRQRLGIPTQAMVLLAFGGSRHDKGVDLALEALALLPPHVHLLVVGSMPAPEAVALRERTGQLGVTDRLHLHLEFVPDEDVEGYFTASDVCLLPYRRNFSGQSGPLGIAASLGLPVLAADVGVLAEMVGEYRLGALFAPEDPAALARCVQEFGVSGSAPDTARFQQDHSPQAFVDAVLRSYRGEAEG